MKNQYVALGHHQGKREFHSFGQNQKDDIDRKLWYYKDAIFGNYLFTENWYIFLFEKNYIIRKQRQLVSIIQVI